MVQKKPSQQTGMEPRFLNTKSMNLSQTRIFVHFRSGHPKVAASTSHQQIWFSNRRKAGELARKLKQFSGTLMDRFVKIVKKGMFFNWYESINVLRIPLLNF